MANHYATLGVSRAAARDEIVRAYRRLARTHHPDVGGDADRFRAVQAAYDVLGDARIRLLYDAELDRLAPEPAPAPAPTRQRTHRFVSQSPITVRRPSPGWAATAVLLAAISVAAGALPALLVLGRDRRIGPAALSLLAGCLLAAAARSVATRQLDRAQRFRMLWAYGFASPAEGDEDAVERCCRLASTARLTAVVVLRGAFAMCAFLLLALAPESVLP